MITYRNTANQNIIKGSEFKINISMDPVDGSSMSDVIFKCTFICGDKKLTVDKEDMIPVDDNNYVVPLNSQKLGVGTITIKYEVDIPDDDFDDGYRHEIAIVNTGISIIQPWGV